MAEATAGPMAGWVSFLMFLLLSAVTSAIVGWRSVLSLFLLQAGPSHLHQRGVVEWVGLKARQRGVAS